MVIFKRPWVVLLHMVVLKRLSFVWPLLNCQKLGILFYGCPNYSWICIWNMCVCTTNSVYHFQLPHCYLISLVFSIPVTIWTVALSPGSVPTVSVCSLSTKWASSSYIMVGASYMMIMMFAWMFIMLAHWNKSVDRHIAPLVHIIMILS